MGHVYEVSRSTDGLDISFMDDGTCRREGHDTRIFFAEYGRTVEDRLALTEAKAICMRCPVQRECFDYALAGCQDGMWGGTTAEDRAFYLRNDRLPSSASVPGVK